METNRMTSLRISALMLALLIAAGVEAQQPITVQEFQPATVQKPLDQPAPPTPEAKTKDERPAEAKKAPEAASQTDEPTAPKPEAKAPARSPKNDDQAIQVLQEIEKRYSGVNTVAGQFHQVMEDPAFQDRIESDAKFYILKPNKFRAEYQPPKVSVNLITDQYSFRYIPELKQVERYQFQNRNTVQDLNYMLLGFGAKTTDLLKVYAVKWLTEGIAQGYYGIELVPVDKETANFKSVTILITKDGNYLPAQFSMEQLSGIRTTASLDMQKLEIGARINESRFRPDFPKDAVYVDIE
jgi:outer membrane lipoprotein-sorting protein